MAAGYLGKVSALVTVNTSDIASKVQSGFAAPFEKALRSIETTLRSTNRSAEQTFANMYTASQKVARAMAAAQMGAVKNFNADEFASKLRIRDDIAAPIAKLASELERTGGIVRGNFEPAIVAAQASAQALFDDLAKKTPVAAERIAAMAKEVTELTAAFQKASATSAGWESLSAIGRAGPPSATSRMFASLGSASARATGAVEARIAEDAAARGRARQLLGGLSGTAGSPFSAAAMAGGSIVDSRVAAKERAKAMLGSLSGSSASTQSMFASLGVKAAAEKQAEAAAKIAADATAKARAKAMLSGLSGSSESTQSMFATLGAKSKAALAGSIDIGAMTILPNNYHFNQREKMKAQRAAQSGDISRMGADKLSLAIQQAGFAVDDFFSVTGNFEQRLRAVGNNLSQLGFIIGSTFGLLAVISVTATTQAVLMLRKFTGATEEAEQKEAKLKATTDAMNSSLDRQRALVEDLSKVYKDLGREIIEATAAPEDAIKAKSMFRAEDLRAQQAAARAEGFASSPFGAGNRGAITYLQKRLEDEPDLVNRFQLTKQLSAARGRDATELAAVEAEARRLVATRSLGSIRAGAEDMRGRVESLAPIIEAIRRDSFESAKADYLTRMEPEFRSLANQLAAFDMALKIATDDSRALGVEGLGPLRDRIAKMQSELAGVEGSDAAFLQSRLGAVGRDMAAAMDTAGTPQEMQRRIAMLGFRASGVLSDAGRFMSEEKAAEQARKDAEREAERAAEARRKSIERGTELVMSPNQLRMSKFRQDMEDASLAATGPDRAGMLSQFLKNQIADAAPGLAQLAQEQAAVPPYYHALSASDASSMEGQKELNRLLRGEDTSKDKNLDELKKQSDLLTEMLALAKQTHNIVVEL
jgi:hypothetical protein